LFKTISIFLCLSGSAKAVFVFFSTFFGGAFGLASAFANILQNSSGLNFNFISSIFSQIVPFTLFHSFLSNLMISLELLVFCWVFAFLLELQNRILEALEDLEGLEDDQVFLVVVMALELPAVVGGRGADILYLLCNHFYYLFIFIHC
jgi:predicted MFS family arabinose efflux permease